MFAKSVFALAVILATASGALAAKKNQSIDVYGSVGAANVYNPAGAYAGADPDPSVRFELRRDWGRGQ